jgi:hypothetical protein
MPKLWGQVEEQRKRAAATRRLQEDADARREAVTQLLVEGKISKEECKERMKAIAVETEASEESQTGEDVQMSDVGTSGQAGGGASGTSKRKRAETVTQGGQTEVTHANPSQGPCDRCARNRKRPECIVDHGSSRCRKCIKTKVGCSWSGKKLSGEEPTLRKVATGEYNTLYASRKSC